MKQARHGSILRVDHQPPGYASAALIQSELAEALQLGYVCRYSDSACAGVLPDTFSSITYSSDQQKVVRNDGNAFKSEEICGKSPQTEKPETYAVL